VNQKQHAKFLKLQVSEYEKKIDELSEFEDEAILIDDIVRELKDIKSIFDAVKQIFERLE
jgi:hypothetical protein